MASTVLNVNVAIDVISEAEKLQALVKFLTESGIDFNLGAPAPAQSNVAAPARKSRKSDDGSSSSKKSKAPVDDRLDLTVEDKHVKVQIVAQSGEQQGKTHFSTGTWAWIKRQVDVIDSKAAYDKYTKMWVFGTKTAAGKFVKAWNGHVVTVDEQMQAMAAK